MFLTVEQVNSGASKYTILNLDIMKVFLQVRLIQAFVVTDL